MKNLSYLILFLLLSPFLVNGQLLSDKNEFSRKDSLRGQLTPLRTCYDVTYYHLDVDINIPKRSIAGSNLIKFKTIQDFNRIQIDLFDNMAIDKILYRGKQLKYTRELMRFYRFPTQIKANTLDSILVYFSGTPHQANRAPWDGGFDWKKDSNNKPWVASANQGIGASLWWPNKDHQSDEPDSVLISVTVPKELMNVSNGRLRNVENIGKKKTKFNWFVSNPINNYNIAINIGDYVHFQDSFNGEKGKLDIDYYVLRENIERAKPHFEANVKPMLKAFEYWFGPYPFYEDSFKLIETSHLGMEHQSGIAYGNRFLNGYLGRDGSGTGWGLSGTLSSYMKPDMNGLEIISQHRILPTCGFMKVSPIIQKHFISITILVKKLGKNTYMAIEERFKTKHRFKDNIMLIMKGPETCIIKVVYCIT
ncbi:hypothetical protein L950_0202670 [Sphingobacterium sp. IITKGP-BTPF85]|nr:hypothetical protein L950_0202670 [Sphingobacterium sp. IITKGP-BTPF85]